MRRLSMILHLIQPLTVSPPDRRQYVSIIICKLSIRIYRYNRTTFGILAT